MRQPSEIDRPAYRLELRLLGSFEMAVDGVPVSPLPSRKARWLLALLALRTGIETPRDWIAETLWRDSETDKALFNLRHTLLELRKKLGSAADCLQSPTPRTLALNAALVRTDAVQFAALSKQETWESLEQAADLYRGSLLADCPDEWISADREVLAQTYLAILEKRANMALAQGDRNSAIRMLRLTIQADPYRESASCALMHALAEEGDRAALVQVYQDLRRRLRQEINTDPTPETFALYQQLMQREGGPQFCPKETAANSDLPASKLPVPLTELVGRELEVAQIGIALREGRLVTLLGTGGIGKTRVSIAVAQGLRSQFPQGVWFINLASLTNADLIPQHLLSTLNIRPVAGISPLESLVQSLADSSMLVVLDNCEHLIDSCRQIATHLLSSCPNLRILATSREMLGVTGERNYPIPPLPIPPSYLLGADADIAFQDKDPHAMLEFGAVRLFVERATQIHPRFRLTPKNVRAVVEICRRLDGLPLAIEMAAARVRTLPVAEILTRLEDRFRLLARGNKLALPRHQTLQAMLDWSHDLLEEKEKALFRRLAVFTGGWTLEAAEAICGDRPHETLDIITSLCDKSLVTYEEASENEARYRYLETVRQYARERLEEQEEWVTFAQHHSQYFLAVVKAMGEKITGKEQNSAIEVLEQELDNVRAAVDFCMEAWDAEIGLEIATGLRRFMEKRGYLEELQRMMVRALSHPDLAAASPKRATGLNIAGSIEVSLGNYPQAQRYYDECYAVADSIGDKREMGNAAFGMGNLNLVKGDLIASQQAYERALVVFMEIGDPARIAGLINNLGLVAMHRANYNEAETLMLDSVARQTQLGNQIGVHNALHNLGFIAHLRGNYCEAKSYYGRSLALIQNTGDRNGYSQSLCSYGDTLLRLGEIEEARLSYRQSIQLQKEIRAAPSIALLLESCGKLALAEGDGVRAARLIGAADALRQSRQIPLPLDEKDDHLRTIAGIREVLGQTQHEREWEAGGRMEMTLALSYALEGTAPKT